MKFKILTLEDIDYYIHDIQKCYKSNRLIFDSQNYFADVNNINRLKSFVRSYVANNDNLVYGIVSDNEAFLYGLIYLASIRFSSNINSAEVHIVTDKLIWGNTIFGLYKQLIDIIPFNILYCQIPSIAVNAIRMCKRMGFKKTGYIPKALPYTNSRGIENMYDIQIWSLDRT